MSATEKVSLSIGAVDLGKVDLPMVQGFCSSRTHFIRPAIRNLMATRSEVVQESVTRRLMMVRTTVYSRMTVVWEIDSHFASGTVIEHAGRTPETVVDISPVAERRWPEVLRPAARYDRSELSPAFARPINR